MKKRLNMSPGAHMNIMVHSDSVLCVVSRAKMSLKERHGAHIRISSSSDTILCEVVVLRFPRLGRRCEPGVRSQEKR